jgi:hypothetical protein
MTEGKRLAVIIGINEYEKSTTKQGGNIPPLKGAENDAKEVRDRLSNPTVGKFDIQNNHFLTGSRATCKAIRTAISDIFRKMDSYDLVLFYFSGHGFVDGRGDGYIAPYDMEKDDPFICGIKMTELREVISESVNKTNVIMILDCCYSGIATQGTKGGGTMLEMPAVVKEKYESSLEGFSGEGRVVLASCEENEESREAQYRHANNNDGAYHDHGAFTFHLLEGMDGNASDERGIITLDKLFHYVEDKMQEEQKEKPTLYIEKGKGIENIPIAIAPLRHKQTVENLVNDAEANLKSDDIQPIIDATDIVNNLMEIDKNNKDINQLINRIDECFKKYVSSIDICLNSGETPRLLRKEAEKISSGLFRRLCNLVPYLAFEKIKDITPQDFNILMILCENISTTDYSIDINNTIRRLNACLNPPKRS